MIDMNRRNNNHLEAAAIAAVLLLTASCAQQNAAVQSAVAAVDPTAAAVNPHAGIGGNPRLPHSFLGESVTIEMDDGYRIGGDHIRHRRFRRRPLPGVIFLHEEGMDRRLFHPITLMTASAGMTVLAIDLRGHGENVSLKGNPDKTYDDLTDEDYAMMLDDVRNAISFLAIKSDVDGGRIAIVGSSLGANLALMVAAQTWAASVRCVIAISPIMDFHGLKPAESMRKIGTGGPTIHLVVGKEDSPSLEAAKTFYGLLREPKELLQLEGPGHGTQLYGKGLLRQIPTWLHEDLVKQPGQ